MMSNLTYLYFVRHGEAHSMNSNRERPLTENGEIMISRLGKWLVERHIEIKKIYHSSLLRSKQSATLLAQNLNLVSYLEENNALNADVAPNALVYFVDSLEENSLLVGHLPNLETVILELLAEEAIEINYQFNPATIICLSRRDNRYAFEWRFSPDDYTINIDGS